MISDHITLLNETTLECLNETDEIKIIRCFTDIGLKVLGSDFGFVWLNSDSSKNFELIYTSSDLPFIPQPPKSRGRNYTVLKSSRPDFVSEIKKTPNADYIRKHIKSFVIIPLVYKKVTYGNMVLCFKDHELFPKEKRTLSIFLGNSVAQTITINRLIKSEQKARILAEKNETELRLLEEESLKVESIADATHELRTPLAIIRGNVELAQIEIEKNKKNNKFRSNGYINKALQNINTEVTNLTGIISDLALLTSEGGQFKNRINHDIVNISELVADIVDRLKNINRKKNISISIKMPRESIIMGDKTYLEKLFSNLIRNAITYGKDNGWIKVVISNKKTSIHVEVSDNGIGIGSDDLPHVFNRFYRADKSHNSNGKRTGLGLAIAKWVTDVHGGTISVKSTLGKGSVFTVVLPIGLANK